MWEGPETLCSNALYITLKVYLFYNFGGTWPSTDFQPLKLFCAESRKLSETLFAIDCMLLKETWLGLVCILRETTQ